MKNFRGWITVGLLGLGMAGSLRADDALKHFQQSLRDQGFYYGPTDGTPGDETTQALKRYQIRNGLPVTGQLDDETRRSIDRTATPTKSGPQGFGNMPRSTPESTPPPLATPSRRQNPTGNPYPSAPTPAPAPVYRSTPAPRPAPRRDNDDDNDDDRSGPRGPGPGQEPRTPPGARRVSPSAALTGFFEGTPYEFAPPPIQADVLRRAQEILLRNGYYDGTVDGRPGPEVAEALSNYQEVTHLRRTGRLDANTLGTLHLLPPRQNAPGRYPADNRRGNAGAIYEGRIVR